MFQTAKLKDFITLTCSFIIPPIHVSDLLAEQFDVSSMDILTYLCGDLLVGQLDISSLDVSLLDSLTCLCWTV